MNVHGLPLGVRPRRPGSRWLIWLAALSAAALLAWRSTAGGGPVTPPALSANGLTEFRSHGGVLAVTLRAAEHRVRIGDLELDGATYNGLYAGPVLRLHPGDVLRLHLINDLKQTTNIHFHGLRTSPLGNSDNAHVAVPPGTSFDYEVRIPVTQPPGLYWYHSHLHGTSEGQVMRGLSGALVIDPSAAAANASPVEQLFVLKDQIFDDETGNPTIDDELHGLVQSINGKLDTTIQMRPRETQLWRFTNQSADRAFHIALQGLRPRIVAEDGEASVMPRDAEVLDIMPSSRVDVLVTADAKGRYALISKGAMTGTGPARTADRVLGHLIVAGPAVATSTALAPPPDAPADLRGRAVDARHTVVFSQTNTLNPDKQKFFVNGQTFDAGRVDIRVKLGNVEEWTVRNDSDDLHVFHIHQLGFQLVAVNGAPVPFTGRVDTIRVPERGSVTLRMAFTDPIIVGRFMFHCHVLKHEDKGMMGQVEVYKAKPPGLAEQVRLLYFHVWWWWHGVPWSLCGLASA